VRKDKGMVMTLINGAQRRVGFDTGVHVFMYCKPAMSNPTLDFPILFNAHILQMHVNG